MSCCIVFFKQKTAYEMRISDWSSDVCSSDLATAASILSAATSRSAMPASARHSSASRRIVRLLMQERSEEHTSELQSLMRISYAVFCLKKKKNRQQNLYNITNSWIKNKNFARINCTSKQTT